MDLLRAINRNVSLKVDAGTAQILCYGIALLIMVFGILKVAAMGLSESQLIFGIVLVMILTIQVIIMGTVVGLHERKSPRRPPATPS